MNTAGKLRRKMLDFDGNALFGSVYRLAKDKNEKELTKEKVATSSKGKGYTVITVLAKEKDYQAVDFLLQRFDANLNDAVFGAALSGDEAFTDKLLQRQAALAYAVRGAAAGGHKAFVNNLLGRGAGLQAEAAYGFGLGNHVEFVDDFINQDRTLIKDALQGAACGGHVELVNALIKRGASLDDAVFGAAFGGHMNLVNELIHRGASLKEAAIGFICGGHVTGTQKEILRFVAFIDHPKLRELFVNEAKHRNTSLDASLVKTAARLNELIRKNKLTFEQAEIYLKVGPNNWFLQGQRLVKEGKLPAELYFHIASFLTESSFKDTKVVFETVNERIHERVINKHNSGFFAFFRSRKSRMEFEEMAEQNHQKRINF